MLSAEHWIGALSLSGTNDASQSTQHWYRPVMLKRKVDIRSIRVSGIKFKNNITKYNYREWFQQSQTASNEQTFADSHLLHRYIYI